jgi:hypothetical protein
MTGFSTRAAGVFVTAGVFVLFRVTTSNTCMRPPLGIARTAYLAMQAPCAASASARARWQTDPTVRPLERVGRQIQLGGDGYVRSHADTHVPRPGQA